MSAICDVRYWEVSLKLHYLNKGLFMKSVVQEFEMAKSTFGKMNNGGMSYKARQSSLTFIGM